MSGEPLLGEDFVPLTPVHFFALELEAPKLPVKHKGSIFSLGSLPNLAPLSAEESCAELALAWSEEGILVEIQVDDPFDHPVYPQVEDGDSVEIFVDTRDLKSAGFNHRFCHHFYLLPAALDGVAQAGEITRFRTEDRHEHCEAHELIVTSLGKGRWQLWLPKSVLVGYDPMQLDRIGFAYRVNRWAKRAPQHFSVHSREYVIDQQPALWSSVTLVR